MKNLIILFSIFFFATVAQADLNVKTYVELLQGNETEKAVVENYVGGVGKGYLWANTIMYHNKQCRAVLL